MTIVNKKTFNEKIFSNIRKLITEYNLIEEGDLIAIALSGGKDSVLTLHALSYFKNNEEFIDFDIAAISVDEGIKNYRNHGIETARKTTKKLGVKYIEKSFKEEFGYALDDIYHYFKSACIPCGVFRRNILNKTAYEIGADKIATGHNMDDEIQSYLMTFSRADILKFSKFGPISDKIHPKLVPRIKPLWDISEKNVGTWVVINEIPVHLDECPYSSFSLRGKTKTFLNQIESDYSGTKQNIMNSFKEIFNIKPNNTIPKDCGRCGEPSSSNTCMSCKIKDFIEKNQFK
ncbi:MAG: TIGR00269 family protein [Methanobrevibacter sp.]|nr:TIGR00269 family protein [Candidatus Methanovirga basalitermitum]